MCGGRRRGAGQDDRLILGRPVHVVSLLGPGALRGACYLQFHSRSVTLLSPTDASHA